MKQAIDSRRLHHLLVFESIVTEGSMTAAARALGVSRGVVSTHLRNLEDELGVRLLERTTRSMSLTQVGEQVLQAAGRMTAAAADAGAAAESERNEVRGQLRVAFTGALWPSLVRPVVKAVRREHPRLSVACFAGDQRVDLVQERIDIAVRVGIPSDSTHVMRRLATDREIIVAAPEVAAQWRDASVNDLAAAPWVAHRHLPRRTLELHSAERDLSVRIRPAVVEVDTARMLLDLVADGLGLAVVPTQVAHAQVLDGRLVRVFPTWHLRAVDLYALLPSRRYNRRTTVFLNALIETLANRGVAT